SGAGAGVLPEQGADQAGMALLLLAAAQAAGDEDRAHLVHRGLEHLVDDHVVELAVVRHLLARGRQAAGDDLVAVLAALAHALLQRLPRRRQDEHADRVGDLGPHLGRALPVDLQQHVVAGRQLRLHRLPRRALPVAVHAGVLEEVAGVDHALELFLADEVVVLGMALARARRARGEGDRQPDGRIARQHRVDDAGLAGAGRRRNDEEGSAHAHRLSCTGPAARTRAWGPVPLLQAPGGSGAIAAPGTRGRVYGVTGREW